MDKKQLTKNRYESPQCSVVTIGTENCVMQTSITTLTIIELSSSGITTETFDASGIESDLWF